MEKSHLSQVITFFSCFGYAANYNTHRAFVIIFLICSDLLNLLRSVDTIVIRTESGQNSLKLFLTKKFLTLEGNHFGLFWCIPCPAPPEILGSSKNINNTAHVPRLSFPFLWLCQILAHLSQYYYKRYSYKKKCEDKIHRHIYLL